MKALMKLRKGDGNVEIQEICEPSPDSGEVKIAVKAAGICGSDIHIYHDDIRIPVKPPVVMGHEFSGIVAEVGKNVKKVKVGDAVTSETAASVCGVCRYCRTGNYNLCPHRLTMGYWINGAFAKYCVVPKERIHKLPKNVDLISAAMCEPLSCCIHGVIEITGVTAGNVVVITGPGAIGLLTLQIAKAEGGRVVMCGTSQDQKRLKIARELGANVTVDVQKENASEIISELTGGYGADVVFECSGAAKAANFGLSVVRKQGKYTQIGLFGKPIEIDFEKIAYKEVKLTGSFSQKSTSWELALRLLSEGKINTESLVSDILPITRWKEGFKKHEEKAGVKIIFTPVN